MRILALDVGTQNIGLALSDPFGITAQPLETVRRKGDEKADLEAVQKVIREREVETVVVGYPKNMNNTEGPSCAMARDFGEQVREQSGLEIVYWDERMTSKIAEDAMIRGDVRRQKRRKNVDALAAVLILQNYLDYLANKKI